MIKTIIFDIGGVLIGYDWTDFMMKLFDNDEALVKKIRATIWEANKWSEIDRGVLTDEELIDYFVEDAPEIRPAFMKFWNSMGDALWQYDFTKDWIKDLKARGYQVLYLSNWSAHLKSQMKDQLDFLPLMDGGVFSYEEHLIKPNHEIYEFILNKYNLKAEECVFIDDKEENVNAARECGLYAVQAKDKNHDIAVEGLEALLK